MSGDADVAAAAALLADRTRCSFVLALIDDGVLPASELAARVGVTASTASEHLARLVDGGVVTSTREGRQRRYSIAGAAVAEAVEALARIAPQPPARSLREVTRTKFLRHARTCYDHLAGAVGVAIADALVKKGALVRSGGGQFALGPAAASMLTPLTIDVDAVAAKRRPLVRGCLDWSERELHVAGALGAAITQRLFDLRWIERRETNRSVAVTDDGAAGLKSVFGIDVGEI